MGSARQPLSTPDIQHPGRSGLNEDLAAEVFQHVFTTLVEQLPNIEQSQRIKAWLVITARRETWRVSRGERVPRVTAGNDEWKESVAMLQDNDPLPEETVVRLEEQHTVYTALADLDERRIAAAALKLHRSGVPSSRQHTPADEMRILYGRLTALSVERPELSSRRHWILDACAELAAELPDDCLYGIHRDFYPDQVLVDGPRLYLLDLDLYTAGDPALDIGNFRGHLIEQSLRSFGRPDALFGCESALSEHYSTLAGTDLGHSIDSYTILTLARHIAISTLFPDRRHLTEVLVDIVEERLGKQYLNPLAPALDPSSADNGVRT